jgi:hypothetical protein
MVVPASLDPPPGMQNSDNIPVISHEEFDAIAAEVAKYREALTEDISLSKEAISARNRLFVSALLTIIVLQSSIDKFSLFGISLDFADANLNSFLRFLAVAVTVALAAHYAAAAFAEYLAESAPRAEREKGIERRLEYFKRAESAIKEERAKDGESKVNVRLDTFLELGSFYVSQLNLLKKQQLIGKYYNIVTPFATIVLMLAMVLAAILTRHGL